MQYLDDDEKQKAMATKRSTHREFFALSDTDVQTLKEVLCGLG